MLSAAVHRTGVFVSFSVVVALLGIPAAADDSVLPTSSEPPLVTQIAKATGHEAFSRLSHLRFTWKHVPSGTARSYDWDLKARRVAVTIDGETVEVPSEGPVPEDLQRAHSAFVNDNYWALFEHHLVFDTVESIEDLGEQAVPGFDELGHCRALAVQYPGEGGYTPGDRYVLYLGAEGLPVAWAFHKGGAEEPSLVTTREGWIEVGGSKMPTRFRRADGSEFIVIEAVEGR